MKLITIGFATKEEIKIEQAFKKVLKCFNDPDFMKHVHQKTNWTYTSCVDGKKIFEKIQDYLNTEIEYYVEAYYNRWSRAHGYTFGNDHMWINTKYKKSVDQYAGTLIHEMCHSVGFSHGDNSPINKENSIPYYIGTLVKNWMF